jgi:hypothetical protein
MFEPGLFRHYKGNLYRAIGLATHSETEEPLVVYHREGDPRLWVRPLDMWQEEVTVDGQRVARFARIGD